MMSAAWWKLHLLQYYRTRQRCSVTCHRSTTGPGAFAASTSGAPCRVRVCMSPIESCSLNHAPMVPARGRMWQGVAAPSDVRPDWVLRTDGVRSSVLLGSVSRGCRHR